MNSGKETSTGQIVVPRLFFAIMFACVLYLAGQTACFASTVVLQWDPNADADLKGYKVYYQADSSTQPFEGAAPILISKTTTTATISGLDPAHPYYFAVTAYNTSDVESAYSNIVYVPELVAPTVSLSYPANNASISGTVSVTASASDNSGVVKRVEFYVNGALQATDTSTPYVFSWNTSSLTTGSYMLTVKAYDAAENVGRSDISVKVINDTTAPTVSVTNPVEGATLRGIVTITADAKDIGGTGVSMVRFYANGNLLTATNVFPYSYNWNTASLTNGASYILSAKAYDAADNVGQSSNVSVTVNNSEVTKPSGTVAINQGTNTNKTAVTLNLTASDASKVAAYCISNTSTCTTWTKLTTPVTPLSIPAKAWTLATGADGNRTVSVWYKDVWDNVSAPASDAIMLDTKAPVNGTLTPTQLAGNQIKLDWTGFSDATSGMASYKLVRGAKLPPTSCTGAAIATPSAGVTTYTETGSQGMNYYYRLCAVDNAGNVSTGATTPAVMAIPEVTKPSGTVAINQGALTNKTAVTLNIAASDASKVVAYCISNTSTCTTWTKLSTPVTPLSIPAKACTLATGADGNRTVSVWFKDVWGNVSDPASDAIMLDTKAPVNGTLTPTQLAGNQIKLDWSGFSDATSGMATYKLVRGATLPATSCTAAAIATPAAGVTTYTETGSQGMKYYYRLCALDNAGNVSTGATTPAVMAIPEVNKPSGTVAINQGALTNKTAVTLNIAAIDASKVAAYCISNTNTCTTWTKLTTPVTPLSIPAKAWTLAKGTDGNRTVSVWYKDVWGNVSAPASASTNLDITP
jgi:chitinase